MAPDLKIVLQNAFQYPTGCCLLCLQESRRHKLSNNLRLEFFISITCCMDASLCQFGHSIKRCTTKSKRGKAANYLVGQPKIFGVSLFKPQPGVWPIIWLWSKFGVPRSKFYHIARSRRRPPGPFQEVSRYARAYCDVV